MLLNFHCNTCMYSLYLYITLRPEFCFEGVIFLLIYRKCGNPVNHEFFVTQSGTPIFKSSKCNQKWINRSGVDSQRNKSKGSDLWFQILRGTSELSELGLHRGFYLTQFNSPRLRRHDTSSYRCIDDLNLNLRG